MLTVFGQYKTGEHIIWRVNLLFGELSLQMSRWCLIDLIWIDLLKVHEGENLKWILIKFYVWSELDFFLSPGVILHLNIDYVLRCPVTS